MSMIVVLYNKDDFIPHQEYTLFFTLKNCKARAYENINKFQLNSAQPQNMRIAYELCMHIYCYDQQQNV